MAVLADCHRNEKMAILIKISKKIKALMDLCRIYAAAGKKVGNYYTTKAQQVADVPV